MNDVIDEAEATTAAMPNTAPDVDNSGSPGARDYAPAGLKNLTPDSASLANGDVNLEVILDIPVTISVEIGRAQTAIRQLLQYSQGSVVELDSLVGEPLNVLVNNTLIAHGEVVVMEDKFGIRLTDVVSPAERVKKLR